MHTLLNTINAGNTGTELSNLKLVAWTGASPQYACQICAKTPRRQRHNSTENASDILHFLIFLPRQIFFWISFAWRDPLERDSNLSSKKRFSCAIIRNTFFKVHHKYSVLQNYLVGGSLEIASVGLVTGSDVLTKMLHTQVAAAHGSTSYQTILHHRVQRSVSALDGYNFRCLVLSPTHTHTHTNTNTHTLSLSLSRPF